jgi:hypothetical protein
MPTMGGLLTVIPCEIIYTADNVRYDLIFALEPNLNKLLFSVDTKQ